MPATGRALMRSVPSTATEHANVRGNRLRLIGKVIPIASISAYGPCAHYPNTVRHHAGHAPIVRPGPHGVIRRMTGIDDLFSRERGDTYATTYANICTWEEARRNRRYGVGASASVTSPLRMAAAAAAARVPTPSLARMLATWPCAVRQLMK